MDQGGDVHTEIVCLPSTSAAAHDEDGESSDHAAQCVDCEDLEILTLGTVFKSNTFVMDIPSFHINKSMVLSTSKKGKAQYLFSHFFAKSQLKLLLSKVIIIC